MKTIFFCSFFIIFLFGPSGGCDPEFEYENNSRVILEGKLVDENGYSLSNQNVVILSTSFGSTIELNRITSDANGNFFISSPNGNTGVYLKFSGKDIDLIQFYPELVKQNSFSDDWIGFFENKHYKFGTITLINN
jgi:hypothetical protein